MRIDLNQNQAALPGGDLVSLEAVAGMPVVSTSECRGMRGGFVAAKAAGLTIQARRATHASTNSPKWKEAAGG